MSSISLFVIVVLHNTLIKIRRFHFLTLEILILEEIDHVFIFVIFWKLIETLLWLHYFQILDRFAFHSDRFYRFWLLV